VADVVRAYGKQFVEQYGHLCQDVMIFHGPALDVFKAPCTPYPMVIGQLGFSSLAQLAMDS
jgi:hypothetical protein